MKTFISNQIMKLVSRVTTQRVTMAMQTQWTPLDFMTPRSLASALKSLKAGDPSAFSRLWDDARQRDDMLSSVEPKRRKDAARTPWEITTADDSAEAKRQKDVLDYFFKNLIVTDVLDPDKSGQTSALIRYMMNAVGFGHSVQEIIWQPSQKGLTAEFRNMPLHFFERRTGRLRYLPQDGLYAGVELDPGGWLITSSDDILGIASLVLYLFKHQPLRDWLIYCDRYAIPGLHGSTTAQRGTEDWNELRDALLNFGQDWALLTGNDVKITPIDASAKGALPYQPLVDRCDRRMSALWRGGDLSTMSSTDGQGTGASLQNGETDVLTADDCLMIEETINAKLVPYILRYTLGSVEPLAHFSLNSADENTQGNITVDKFLIDAGVPLAKNYLREKYGRPAPKEGEEIAQSAAAVPATPVDQIITSTETKPTDGAPAPVVAQGAETVADTAMNGAQVTSLLEIISKVSIGEIPLSIAPALIKAAFPALPDERITSMLPTPDQIKPPVSSVNAETQADAVYTALAKDLQPVRERIAAAIELPDDQMIEALKKIKAEAPTLFRSIADSGLLPQAIEMKLAQAIVEGTKTK